MRLNIDGVGYRVEMEGAGPPLLLLHGFTGSRDTWEPYLASWRRYFQVVRVDIIGHGDSDAPENPSRYAMDRVAADVAGILDRLQIPRVSILGYSMGGRLALSFAGWYPERVDTLILESSSPGLKEEAERRSRRGRDEALADWIEDEGVEAFVRYWERIPLFATQAGLPAEVRKALREERLANRARGLANSLRGMGTGAQPSWWERLGEIPCPVLLITGEADEKFCRIAEEMKGRFRRSEWRMVPETGHAVHLEDPSLFDTIVVQFLTHEPNSPEACEGG